MHGQLKGNSHNFTPYLLYRNKNTIFRRFVDIQLHSLSSSPNQLTKHFILFYFARFARKEKSALPESHVKISVLSTTMITWPLGRTKRQIEKKNDQNTIGPIYRRYLLAVFFPILRTGVDGELELINFDRF